MKLAERSPAIVELGEWQTIRIPDRSLTARDRRLLRGLDSPRRPRLTVRELRDGLEVQAYSWVGVIRLGDLEIRVVPKLTGGNLNLVRMIEFTSGVNALRKSAGVRFLAKEGSALVDLIALLLATECERLIAGGLLTDYVEREDLIGVVRGRLLADRQALERFGQVDRIFCRFDEREQDVPENQLLLAALARARRVVTSRRVLARLRRSEGVFRSVCSFPHLRAGELRSIMQYDRLNEHYRDAHVLGDMLLDALGIDELFEPGPIRSFAFMLDMNSLFEQFVYKVVQQLTVGLPFRASYQVGRPLIWNSATGRPYRRVRPDIILRATDGRGVLPIDAKYKLYSEKRITPADTYQAFVYSYAFAPRDSENRAAAIVYPSTSGELEILRLSVKRSTGLRPAALAAVGLPIARVLDELRGERGGECLDRVRSVLLEVAGEQRAA